MILARIAVVIGISLASLVVYKTFGLFRYILQAKRTNLPYTLTWSLETESIGYIFTPILRWLYQDYLLEGRGWPHWCRLMIKDWSFEDKRRAHDEFGDVFLAVSPEGIICYACDAAMGWDVLNRRSEFTKLRDKYKLLEIYGPNVTTTEGKTFQFHVRIVAPPFADNTGANGLVWNETRSQTNRLVSSWSCESPSSVQSDVNGLTLAVIAKAGFGQELEWKSESGNSETALPAGHSLTFLEAMTKTMIYMIPVLLMPRWLMRITPLRHAAIAHGEFEHYVREMIRMEKYRISKSGNNESTAIRGNLLTSVLQASADHASAAEKSNDFATRKQSFTEDEVMGNLFLYLLAGYETTANSILYGLICLALYPDMQEHVIGELDRVHREAADQGRSDLTYSDDFSKLEYTYGFMYETLRLFPAPQQITKMVSTPTTISVSTPSGPQLYRLPAGCRVYLNVPATHHTERYWPNPYKFDPKRWVDSDSTPSDASGKRLLATDRNRHTEGAFLTFSGGARACLGRKFAQSEFVAFIVTLLKGCRVKLRKDMDPKVVEKMIYLRCKGTLTLAPLDNVKLVLEKREIAR